MKIKPITGTLHITKKGFGFVKPENGSMDVFISKYDLSGAMHGDFVEVKLYPIDDRHDPNEGAVKQILTRSVTEIVGKFEKDKKHGFVVPNDRKIQEDILVHKKDYKGAQKGDIVVVKIVKYPDDESGAEGKITEIISRSGDPGSDIKALIRQFNLIEPFPRKVIAETNLLSQAWPEDGTITDIGARVDLRDKMIITIDGADAKDLDDAVSVSKKENSNYLLGVHIADVSYYVSEDTALDKEALKRGNSVYLIDQVIPMLPKALSNGICSLNPAEDRLTLSIDMEITPEGEVVSHHIYESVIRSKARMVYTDVSDILENNDEELIKKYAFIHQDLLQMNELAAILRARRESRGSLDFEFDEAFIKLDATGKTQSVQVAERRTANKLIEEFMLIANETIAEHFFWLDTAFVYRVHEKPSWEKMEEFKAFIKNFGLILKGNPENIHPKELNQLLAQVSGKSHENVVNTVMLRSMKKAFYSTSCDGHFGLGVKYYCHFTSPIRRYPDLMIHRIIKESLAGTLDSKRNKILKRKTDKAAEVSSATERKALELEREVEKMKKAEYMAGHIGEIYEGIISGVTSFGLYVELANTIEGMVRLDCIGDDFYDFEPQKYRLIGRHTNRVYALGDKLTVRVHSVSIEDRHIDFVIQKSKIKKGKEFN